jgi:hypothetical protein
VVNWLNGGEEISQDTGKRGRPASNLPLVLQAINRALNDHGQLRPTRDGERNTVTWQQAVDCYLELTPPEDDDPEADALKAERKFREAVNGKSGRDVIGFQAAKKRDKSEALLWLLHRSRV